MCVELALLWTCCLAIDVLCLTIENDVMAAFIDCVLIEYLFCFQFVVCISKAFELLWQVVGLDLVMYFVVCFVVGLPQFLQT